LFKLDPLSRNLAISAAVLIGLGFTSCPVLAAGERPPLGITHDVISFLGFGPDQANNPTDPQPAAEQIKTELALREIAASAGGEVQAPPQRLPAMIAAAPSVETPLHRLFCVEYARMRSGMAVFGDARHWWNRARNLYGRMSRPIEEAVMVFSSSKRLKRGHVAVVTSIVGPRQIIVDQANWENKGEIDHATPVLDVSPANDWSLVRVWDIRSGSFGSHVYAISGFITKGLTAASRD
jgi:CHAP domain